MIISVALALGFALDLIFGDPDSIVHPVVLIGRLISAAEKFLRSRFPDRPDSLRSAGVALWVIVVATTTLVASCLLFFAARLGWFVYLVWQSFICFQLLAAKTMKNESMKVYDALVYGDLEAARYAVSMIVGRDTQQLDAAGVTRACVETIAESAADGIISPMFYFALAGGVPMAAYKAVNTLDSMVGYKNDRYMDLGRFSAKADDFFNFLPARVGGVLMAFASFFVGLDAAGAFRVFFRDRKNHSSPNSAHTEAACAGALGLRLGGANHYFGRLVEKPYIGDDTRPIEPEDIKRAIRLLYATDLVATLVFIGARTGLIALFSAIISRG